MRVLAAFFKVAAAALGDRILPGQRNRPAADERSGLAQNVDPQRGIERRIVDFADQCRQSLSLVLDRSAFEEDCARDTELLLLRTGESFFPVLGCIEPAAWSVDDAGRA